jgi:hypothetical protein
VRIIPRKGKGVGRILKEERRYREKRKQGEKQRSKEVTQEEIEGNCREKEST